MSERKVKLRFHLGHGPHFMHWQLTTAQGVEYINPSDVSIILTNCYLRNQKGAAQKIHDGAKKTVCAWVEAEGVTIGPLGNPCGEPLEYNPRVAPNWRMMGDNVDGKVVQCVVTSGPKLFAQGSVV